MKLDKAFGEALRQARYRANLSQEDFADEVSREMVSLLERGQRSPRLSQIDAIAGRIGLHPLTLLTKCYLLAGKPDELNTLLTRLTNEIGILEEEKSNPFLQKK